MCVHAAVKVGVRRDQLRAHRAWRVHVGEWRAGLEVPCLDDFGARQCEPLRNRP